MSGFDYNLERDREITESLYFEWRKQMMLYQLYAERSAYADDRCDRIKAKRDLVAADLDFDIRKNPEKYEIKSTSNDVVASTVLRQPQYQEALKMYHDAKRDAAICRIAVDVMEQKKRAMENLIIGEGKAWDSNTLFVSKAEKDRIREQVVVSDVIEFNRRVGDWGPSVGSRRRGE